jgi:hypothetical protein
MSTKKQWMDNLDRLKARLKLDSDVALSYAVGVSPAMLAHVRAGRRPLPLPARLRLLDKLGYKFTRERIISLLPEDAQAAIEEIENRKHGRRG